MEEAAMPTSETNSHPPLRVLIVEDDTDTADSTATLVRLRGHGVVMASDAASAMETITTLDVDAVLLDIGLPGTNGLVVAKWITDRATEKKPFLIAVIGYGREEERQRAQKAGIHLHMLK